MLWVIVAVLAIAVGMRYTRLHNGQSVSDATLKKDGFDSNDDLNQMSDILNRGKLQKLSDSEYAFLLDYAGKKGMSQDMVCGALMDITNDSLAQKCIPIASKILNTGRNVKFIGDTAAQWRQDGCPHGADQLQALLISKSQGKGG